MGYLLVDHTASSGIKHEYNTSSCAHCGAVIIYKSKPIGGFLRKVRVSLWNGREDEEIGEGFFCTRCMGDICKHCGEASTKGGSIGPCMTQQRLIDLVLARR